MTFENDFEKANRVIHPVEKEWHYPIMAKAGFEAKTKTGIGFVRSYEYQHPSGRAVRVTTGVNADHWEDKTSGDIGYWSKLEAHLKSLNLVR